MNEKWNHNHNQHLIYSVKLQENTRRRVNKMSTGVDPGYFPCLPETAWRCCEKKKLIDWWLRRYFFPPCDGNSIHAIFQLQTSRASIAAVSSDGYSSLETQGTDRGAGENWGGRINSGGGGEEKGEEEKQLFSPLPVPVRRRLSSRPSFHLTQGWYTANRRFDSIGFCAWRALGEGIDGVKRKPVSWLAGNFPAGLSLDGNYRFSRSRSTAAVQSQYNYYWAVLTSFLSVGMARRELDT